MREPMLGIPLAPGLLCEVTPDSWRLRRVDAGYLSCHTAILVITQDRRYRLSAT